MSDEDRFKLRRDMKNLNRPLSSLVTIPTVSLGLGPGLSDLTLTVTLTIYNPKLILNFKPHLKPNLILILSR
jgi:hypothetical protein